MSKKPPPQVLFNFQEEDINKETGEENPNFVYEDDENASAPKGHRETPDKGEELIKIEEKEQIISKDIFDDMPDNIGVIPDEVKEVLMEEGIPLTPKVPEKPVKPKKKRKPMSEEHKQKLALAREKAMIVRKAKAEEKKKMKALDTEEKELLKTQKIKRVKKLKEDVDSDDAEVQKSKPSPSSASLGITTFTKKDLEDAQYDAIMKYDAVRKQRKKEKKEAEMIERDKQKMLNTIQKATGNYSYRDGSNRWDNCY